MKLTSNDISCINWIIAEVIQSHQCSIKRYSGQYYLVIIKHEIQDIDIAKSLGITKYEIYTALPASDDMRCFECYIIYKEEDVNLIKLSNPNVVFCDTIINIIDKPLYKNYEL